MSVLILTHAVLNYCPVYFLYSQPLNIYTVLWFFFHQHTPGGWTPQVEKWNTESDCLYISPNAVILLMVKGEVHMRILPVFYSDLNEPHSGDLHVFYLHIQLQLRMAGWHDQHLWRQTDMGLNFDCSMYSWASYWIKFLFWKMRKWEQIT